MKKLLPFPPNSLTQGHPRRGQGLVKWLLLIVAAIRTRLKNALKQSSAPASQDRWQGQQGLCPLVLKVISLPPPLLALLPRTILTWCEYIICQSRVRLVSFTGVHWYWGSGGPESMTSDWDVFFPKQLILWKSFHRKVTFCSIVCSLHCASEVVVQNGAVSGGGGVPSSPWPYWLVMHLGEQNKDNKGEVKCESQWQKSLNTMASV